MAESLQDIKRRIKSVTSTEHVTNAMKLVSTAKLRVAKNKFETMNKNLLYVAHHISALFNYAEEVPWMYLVENKYASKTCYIVVSSNKGFCGGYNTSILKEVDRLIEESDKDAIVFAFGSKAAEHYKKHPRATVFDEYLEPIEEIEYSRCREFIAPVLRMYRDKEIDKVILVYTAFETLMKQVVKAETILPFPLDDAVYATTEDGHVPQHLADVEFLPNTDEMFNYLVEQYFQIDLFADVIEAATCEHTSRRMAMENATDNANEMLAALSLNYNRARQSAITSEITEIVAGTEVLK